MTNCPYADLWGGHITPMFYNIPQVYLHFIFYYVVCDACYLKLQMVLYNKFKENYHAFKLF